LPGGEYPTERIVALMVISAMIPSPDSTSSRISRIRPPAGQARDYTLAFHHLLPRVGAIPVKERVVRDGSTITGGVTAGVRLKARRRGPHKRGYRFEGQATFGGLLAALGIATSVGVPDGIRTRVSRLKIWGPRPA
jgi:hypothetical protein